MLVSLFVCSLQHELTAGLLNVMLIYDISIRSSIFRLRVSVIRQQTISSSARFDFVLRRSYQSAVITVGIAVSLASFTSKHLRFCDLTIRGFSISRYSKCLRTMGQGERRVRQRGVDRGTSATENSRISLKLAGF